MDEIKQMSMTLAEKMQASSAYQNYLYYKEKLQQNETLKNKIMDFKKKQIDIEVRKTQNTPVSMQEEYDLSDMYSEIMLNDIGAGFIENERSVIQLLSNVFAIIGNNVKVDMDYME